MFGLACAGSNQLCHSAFLLSPTMSSRNLVFLFQRYPRWILLYPNCLFTNNPMINSEKSRLYQPFPILLMPSALSFTQAGREIILFRHLSCRASDIPSHLTENHAPSDVWFLSIVSFPLKHHTCDSDFDYNEAFMLQSFLVIIALIRSTAVLLLFKVTETEILQSMLTLEFSP